MQRDQKWQFKKAEVQNIFSVKDILFQTCQETNKKKIDSVLNHDFSSINAPYNVYYVICIPYLFSHYGMVVW